MRRTIVSASLATATLLGAGGVAASLFGAAGASAVTSSAETDDTTTPAATTESTTTESTATDSTAAASAASATPADPALPAPVDRSTRLSDTIAKLVTDGTLTRAQADKVVAALKAAAPLGGPHGGRHGGANLEVAATALGMTTTDLATSLRDGKSLAAIATEKSVDVQKVIDALVADAKARAAQAVTDGRLTQAQVDERATSMVERITAMVNRVGGPGHGPGGFGDRGRGIGGPAGSSAAEQSSTSTSGTVSTGA
jgi:hypothetical protein